MYIFNEVLYMSSIHFRLPGSQYGGLDLEGLYMARLLDHMLNKQNFSRKNISYKNIHMHTLRIKVSLFRFGENARGTDWRSYKLISFVVS